MPCSSYGIASIEQFECLITKQKLNEVLQLYKKYFSNVLCIIGNSFSTNLCSGRVDDCYFEGFASHQLHLGIKSISENTISFPTDLTDLGYT